jgi:hypothetical protein
MSIQSERKKAGHLLSDLPRLITYSPQAICLAICVSYPRRPARRHVRVDAANWLASCAFCCASGLAAASFDSLGILIPRVGFFSWCGCGGRCGCLCRCCCCLLWLFVAFQRHVFFDHVARRILLVESYAHY